MVNIKYLVAIIFLFISLQTAVATVISCSKGQFLVRSHKRLGYYRSDGTYISPTRVSAYCKNYRKNQPAELIFPPARKGFKKISKKEMNSIVKAFRKIPHILTGIGKIKIYRQDKDQWYPENPARVYEEKKEIFLYDIISQYSMDRVIAHELAHILYNDLPEKIQKSYDTVAEWRDDKSQGTLIKKINNRKNFVASDGRDSPSEDFANNIEYYLYEKKLFKQKNPQIYKWVKQFMEDKKK